MEENKRIELVRKVFWDYRLTESEISMLVNNSELPEKGITTRNYYHRLLTSFKWYLLIDLLSAENIKQALSEENLRGLFPPKLAENYRYVRRFL